MTTRYEDEWTCSVCGGLFGRHDMCFEDHNGYMSVCGECDDDNDETTGEVVIEKEL